MASSGNFATLLNGLLYQVGTNTTYSIGNTKYQSSSAGAYSQQASTIAPSSGKWYAEMYVNTVGNLNFLCLVGDVGVSDTTNNNAYPNRSSNGGMGYAHSGLVRFNGSDTSSGYSTYTDGDIIQIAFDIDNTKVWFGKNNTWQNSGDPANGTNASYTTWTTTYSSLPKNWHVAGNIANTGANTFNFGQDDTFGGVITAAGNADGNGHGVFKYAPPTGFLALCSANLPISDAIDPAQTDDDYPGKQMNVVKYTGNDGTSSNNINYGFKPDLVIHKDLDGIGGGYPANVWDTSRGDDYYMYTDGTAASTTSGSDYLEFTSTGVKLDTSWDGLNHNGGNYISQGWRANGGTTSTNNEGNHTCTLQANAKGGFSIMTLANYTSASGVTIGHGLDTAPSMYWHKSTANTSNWHVYHSSLGATKAMLLNSSNSEATAIGYWANTEPTADVLSLGNTLAGTYAGIVYAWAEVDGYSKFGKYEGNGNADGPFVYTGFRPRMLFLKSTDTSDDWIVIDTARSTFNVTNAAYSWNVYGGQATSNRELDIYSNGFKPRTSNTNLNKSGTNYIYGAWGDVPFKYNNTF